MKRIKAECVDSAIGMLNSKHSKFIGWVGNIRYYVVDGKVWSWAFGGNVARSDDQAESDQIIKSVTYLNRDSGECDICQGDLPFNHKGKTCPECLLIILVNGSTEEGQ